MTPAPRRQLIGKSLGAAVVLYGVFIGTRWGQRADSAAKVYAQVHRYTPRLRSRGLPPLRDISLVIPLVATAITLVLLAMQPRTQRWRAVVAVAAVVIPGVMICQALKVVLPYPALTKYPDWIGSSTFPSGHTAFVSGLALSCYGLMPRRMRFYGSYLSAVMVFAITVGVVVDGRHRPSETASAVAVVVAWYLSISPFVTVMARSPGAHRSPTFRVSGYAAGACSLGLAASVRLDDFPPAVASVDRAFAAAVLLAASTSLLFHDLITVYFSDRDLRWTRRIAESTTAL